MAENKEADEKEGAVAAAPPASKKKLFIVIGAVALLLMAIGIPAAIVLSSKPAENKNTELDAKVAEDTSSLLPAGHDDEEELVEGEEPLGAFYPLETFVVNLTGGKFIRVQVQLEFTTPDISRRFYARQVIVRDALISVFSALKASELQTFTEREALKAQVKDAVNEVLKKEEVKQVYFTQFIVQ